MSRWYTFHIKNEILVWFLVLALLPLLVLTTINYQYQKEQYEQTAKQDLFILLNQKMNLINSHVNLVQNQINILSMIPNTKEAFEVYKQTTKKSNPFYENYFSKIIDEDGFYDLFLIDTNGDIIYSVKKEDDLYTNLSTGKYSNTNLGRLYKNTMELLDTQISDFEFYSPSNEDAFFLATPVYGENKILGMIAVQLDTRKIDQIFQDNEGLGKSGSFFAAKLQDGKIVATTSIKKEQSPTNYNYQSMQKENTPIFQATHGSSGHDIIDDFKGQRVVAAWSYIPYFKWGVVVKINLDEVLEPIEELKFYSILILFFVGLGIVIAILAAIKNIVEPIEKLTQNVKNFSHGKLNENNTIEVENEIGELSRNFMEMAYSLQTSQNTIQKYANELEEKVQERTRDLEIAKQNIEQKNLQMENYLNIINTNVITSTTDISGTIIKVSQAFCEITGYEKDELIGKKHNLIRHPDMPSEIYKDLWNTIQSGKTWKGEIKNLKKDGSFYWVDSTVSPVYEDGKLIAFTSVRQDITNKKLIEEISITDQLTGLFNRRKIEEVFEQQIQRASRYNEVFGVVVLDIDHFKSVNDTYGHDVGDMTIVDIANLLKTSVRNTDIVGRWGGEEFVVITINTNLQDTLNLCEKIRTQIETHTFKVIEHKTASFGVSSYKQSDTQNSLIKRADEALYKAKESGRNCVVSLES
jgi:diguanylate cyclase (GGDEF)-like protein/PAS domain S-box-containing protein